MTQCNHEIRLAQHRYIISNGEPAEILEVEVNGDWAVLEVVGEGFLAAWYNREWRAREFLLPSADGAKVYAVRKASKVGRIRRMKENGIAILLAMVMLLALFGIAQIARPYLPEPDPLSVPQFHGENR